MVDPGIATAMANPPFPGYVSGHSAISATAATVLDAMLPDSGYWQRSAEEARDSRLYAGIHLDVDNQAGFTLGRVIGVAIVHRYRPLPDSSWAPNRDAPEPLLPAAPVDGASGVLAAQEAATVSNESVGNLYLVSKVGHKRAFLVASRDALPLAPGWRAQLLSTDGAWEPGACASAPSAVLGDRYVVYAEFQQSLYGATSRLVVFDVRSGLFRTMVLGSRAVLSVSAIDDHTVALLDQNEPLVRLVNVTDGSYIDRYPTALVLSSIDGVREVPRSIGVDDVTYVDAGGSVLAEVFGWRAPQLKGWDDGRGYFMASPTQTSSPAPGVYNAAADTWEWVFTEEIDNGSGNGGLRYVVLGTAAN